MPQQGIYRMRCSTLTCAMYASFPPCAAGTGSNAIGLTVVGGVSVARATEGPSLTVTGNGQEGQGKLGMQAHMGLISNLSVGSGEQLQHAAVSMQRKCLQRRPAAVPPRLIRVFALPSAVPCS